MTTTHRHRGLPRLRVRWRSLAWQGLLGFLFGYAVLHPVSMMIFQCLDPRMTAMHNDPASSAGGGLLAPIALSFTLHHLPMALAFGAMAALVAVAYGYHRLAISFQRDCLAEELQHNEKLRDELAGQAQRLQRKNEELARLELANRRTTQFMAHDFKTAVGCVGGFAEQLLRKPALREDEEVAGALCCIRRKAHQMMGSVMDLLQLARMRERGEPSMQPTSVAELLREAASDFSLPAHANQVVLGEEHLRCPAVAANRQLLRRVLCNLVSNALKHNDPGTRVWLDARADAAGREVTFSCRDDGGGVPPELLPSLFCEFTTTGDACGGSTGLGLAFCKAAVESHGGRTWCENLPQGTRFCFTIPYSVSGGLP